MLFLGRRCLPVIAVILALQFTQPCQAQSYKDGECVEVLYLNSWLPAIVVNTNTRGEVLAEFTFGVRPRREWFKKDAVRAEYESGAIARGRTWSDTTGSFKIKAALFSVNDDELLLRKPDMTEVKVALSKLSDGDKAYLKKLQKSLGLAGESGPAAPEIESFASGATFGSSASYGAASGRPAVPSDPLPAYLKLKQGGCGFPAEDFFDKVGTVLPVGGPDQWLLAGIENSKPFEAFTTRLYWVSLARQKVEKRQLLPPGERVLDYHPPSRRVLTYNGSFEDSFLGKSTLTVWEATPKDEKVKPIARWYAESSRWNMNHPWGRMIDGNLVLQRADQQRYVVWDIAAKQSRYEVTQESFFAPDVVLSPGRKFLFLPEDSGVRVLKCADGSWVTNLPVTDGCAGVAVSEHGRLAAALGHSTLSVFDISVADAPPTIYQAEAIGNAFEAKLAWLGSERLAADTTWGFGLFSLKNKLTLWNYEFDMTAVSEVWGARVREIVDQHLVYAAKMHGFQDVLAVGAVKLPGPGVEEMEARLDRDQLHCLRPGASIRLDVKAGEYTDRVTQALEAKIRDNGWVVSPTAPVTLVAEMKQGEARTVNYRFWTLARGEWKEQATFAPFHSTLTIQVSNPQMGNQYAWFSSAGGGPPPMIRLKEGDSVQAEVEKWQKPRPEFFDTVQIPDRVLDPKYHRGLGTTRVTSRGLIPKNEPR
jgi:SLA1 homology domain 1, SHD1